MVEEVKNENKPGKVKTAADIVKEIEDKNFSGELGKVRKKLEDIIPVRDKAREALDQVETQVTDIMEEYTKLLARKS